MPLPVFPIHVFMAKGCLTFVRKESVNESIKTVISNPVECLDFSA